jgi:hypothetical protein
MSLLTTAQKSEYDDALYSLFEAFRRPMTVYIEAARTTISTSPTYSRFGQHDQMAAIGADNPAVTPQSYVISGCITYGNKQPWDYVEPGTRRDYQQNKLRESFGVVKIQVDATGNALLATAKQVTLDGFNFEQVSTPRPHGLVTPTRWTHILQKVD